MDRLLPTQEWAQWRCTQSTFSCFSQRESLAEHGLQQNDLKASLQFMKEIAWEKWPCSHVAKPRFSLLQREAFCFAIGHSRDCDLLVFLLRQNCSTSGVICARRMPVTYLVQTSRFCWMSCSLLFLECGLSRVRVMVLSTPSCNEWKTNDRTIVKVPGVSMK